MTTPDYYAILRVSGEATTEEIKQAYRRLARRHHPDVNPPEDDERAAKRMAALNEAYSVLTDPQASAEYDRQTARPHPGATAAGTPCETVSGRTLDGEHSLRSQRASKLALILIGCAMVTLLAVSVLARTSPDDATLLRRVLHWLALDTAIGRWAWAIVLVAVAAMIPLAARLTEL